MARRAEEIMSRSGPEDAVSIQSTGTNSSPEYTAGSDYSLQIRIDLISSMYYKDIAASNRYTGIYTTRETPGLVARDVMRARNLCSKQAFTYELCRTARYAHQEKQCAPAAGDLARCGTKFVRALDMLCRKEFVAFTECLQSSNGDRAKCFKEYTALDMCTEDF